MRVSILSQSCPATEIDVRQFPDGLHSLVTILPERVTWALACLCGLTQCDPHLPQLCVLTTRSQASAQVLGVLSSDFDYLS